MNHRTLNDLIDEAKQFLPRAQIKVFDPLLEHVKQAPLFILNAQAMDAICGDVALASLAGNRTDGLCLPFESFRAIIGNRSALIVRRRGNEFWAARFDQGKTEVIVALFHASSEDAAICIENLAAGVRYEWGNIHSVIICLRPEPGMFVRDNDDIKRCRQHRINPIIESATGKPFAKTELDHEAAKTPLLLFQFLALVNHPRHHTCHVGPKANGQPVTWVEARSHYIILDSSHGRQQIAGQRDFDGSITRAMHSRRAHWRRFKAECFKRMKGQKRWILSAWCGPKEWEGTDHKVYKILERQPMHLVDTVQEPSRDNPSTECAHIQA